MMTMPRAVQFRWLQKLVLPLCVALLTILVTREELLNLGVVERLELASVDFRFQARGPVPHLKDSSHIVIVEISRESFESLPAQWPWPRSYYAKLIRNLARAGAKVVGIDILFVGGDMYTPDNDQILRDAIKETGTVVLAGKVDVAQHFYRLRSSLENYGNVFYQTDSSLGVVNIRKDADDVVRRYLPFVEIDSTLRLPTFGFAVLNKYFGFRHENLPELLHDAFRFADRILPRYDASSLLINYLGPSGSFRTVKFSDVLDDESFKTVEEASTGVEMNTFSDPDYGYLYDGTFQNKIVLVGSTMPEDQDLHSVPLAQGLQSGDNKMYGVEIHANLVESVLRGAFLTRQSTIGEILMIVVLSVLTFYATSAIKGSRTSYHMLVELNGFLFVVAELFVVGFISLRLFIDSGYVMAMVSPLFAIVGGYFASTVYHFVSERKQRLMIKSMFSTYVSPSIVDQLITDPEKLKLGGERRELSVLFSDLEGFTTLAEDTPPEQLVGLLNEYLSTMTQVVLRNKGTLDKFEGDMIMTFWGAPIPLPDHALRACTTALQMQSALAAIRHEWGMQNKPLLFARIGVNTGEMVVGNMGSAEKFNYTVIGDSVNLASRLEGANKLYKTQIIIGEEVYRRVNDTFLCRELDILTVKGRSESVHIYELRAMLENGKTDPDQLFVACYEEGLRAYKERRWNDAQRKFREALTMNPNDHPTQLYMGRTDFFENHPPPADWDGRFTSPTS